MRCCARSPSRAPEPFSFVRTNRNDDFVRRKRRKTLTRRDAHRLTSTVASTVSPQRPPRVRADPCRMTERFLVVGEPVEAPCRTTGTTTLTVSASQHAGAKRRHAFDGADDEYVPAHAWKRTAEDSPPHTAGENRLATQENVGGCVTVRGRASRRWLRLSSVSGLAKSSTTGSARRGEVTEGYRGSLGHYSNLPVPPPTSSENGG